MNTVKKPLTRVVDAVNSLGFSFIIGAILYFIIGSVASLVGGKMLDWTFCGSAHYLAHVEWCGIGTPTGGSAVRYFTHRLMNVPLPWLMLAVGFALTAICSLLLKMLGYRYSPPGSKA